MAKRTVIGVPFNYDESWIGGIYYVKNIIASFSLLPAAEQPHVCLLSHERQSWEYMKRETGYAHLEWLQPSFLNNVSVGPSRKWLFLQRLTPRFLRKTRHFDVIFPSPISPAFRQTVCWIPDFQDKHLPQFFSPQELATRTEQHQYYYRTFRHIVFSSQSALADFERFYPDNTVNKYVVRFAVFDSPIEQPSPAEVQAKHGLPPRFFYCPNQFWVHKNHVTVIRAVAELKRRGKAVHVVFSGKEHDHRAPNHVDTLKQLATELGVADRVSFVGFLPRNEQVVLFRCAALIIQPSLFEGWSTVIEDAKAVSQHVIASDIPTHREQLECNAAFFPATDPGALADRLEPYVDTDPARTEIDYRSLQRRFADDFIKVVTSVMAVTSRG